ncbi:hypothetical protein Q8W38_23225 [Vibrio splendidus]|uniref:Uncharacterized protein n=1 Tax=Vibrio splendidus TaxID=29497 RepID=A0ABD5AIX0_VIBSP|nr:hypothetical protein [Vibrio splendidus]MDP2492271.1 hypothetical protein [Vibrio splendidus]
MSRFKDAYISIAVGLVLFGLFGIHHGEIHLPSKGGHGVTLEGDSLYVLFSSFVVLAIACIIIVADHYDKRKNEHLYDLALKGLGYISLALYIVAVIWNSRRPCYSDNLSSIKLSKKAAFTIRS